MHQHLKNELRSSEFSTIESRRRYKTTDAMLSPTTSTSGQCVQRSRSLSPRAADNTLTIYLANEI